MAYSIGKYKGINHWAFKGNNIGYMAIHKWLRENFGNACKCENCGKIGNGRKIHWAKLKGKEYERKRENFWQLCSRCHRIYDGTWNKGKKLSEEHKIKLSFAHLGKITWNKGTKGLMKANSTSFKKGHPAPKTAFKKGQPSAFKGRKHTPEAKEKNRLAHLSKNPKYHLQVGRTS